MSHPKPQASKAMQLLLDALDTVDVVLMVQRLGGTRWSVPASGRLPDGHLWIQVLGDEKAGRLARYLAGEADIRIPRDIGIIDHLIYESRKAGLGVNDLALMYGKDVRSIIRAIGRHRQAMAEKAQMGLFD